MYLATLGLMFILVGVLSELFGGSYFRRFFDWDYGRWPGGRRGNGERVKLLAFRAMFLIGVVLTAIGLLATFTV
jgi:hypothetical protein